ncbi:YbaN family protein [Pseudoxanthomonas sp. JBR18]|uniref:YbaN family protein n=1 Tax=Pseudoxanthomonas sp. JBR18 TaxID=2969308 RepID=UPI002304DE30|nr:YbaN family protein [Pseudoxanthomonas sp. JBR18]WCE03595.1 YbaN family protein [Pseudoxanthomonas sp. JBR18]
MKPLDSAPVQMPTGGLGRVLLRILAVVSLGVAFVGVVTPGLPTIEFVLLAAWAAARSSPRLHAWILRHRVFGPLLAHWQAGRLPRRAKWAATGTMALAGIFAALTIPHRPSVVIIVGCMACVLLWLWCRPEP